MKEPRKKLLYSDIVVVVISYIVLHKDDYNNSIENNYLDEIVELCNAFLKPFRFFERTKIVNMEDVRPFFQHIDHEFMHNYFPKGLNRNNDEVLNNTTRNKIYRAILSTFNKRLNKIIDDNLDDIQDRFSDNPFGYKQTFLSYSYADKGLTLILFFYFLANQGYLYIDWMHSPAYENGVAIKSSLSRALSNSDQLLFLYTPNSEMRFNEKRSLKEWCSWEFGSFYSSIGSHKYYIRVPSNFAKYEVPDILDTFKEFESVSNGEIIGNDRSVMEFYMPYEKDIASVSLNLLINYVSDRYSRFVMNSGNNALTVNNNCKYLYDAYDSKGKTALEFSLLIDSPKKMVDKKFLFTGDTSSIDRKEKGIYTSLYNRIINKIRGLNAFNNLNDKYELIILLPTRYSTAISKDDENRLLRDVDIIRNQKIRYVYLIFIDSIHRFAFGKKGKIAKFNYCERDV